MTSDSETQARYENYFNQFGAMRHSYCGEKTVNNLSEFFDHLKVLHDWNLNCLFLNQKFAYADPVAEPEPVAAPVADPNAR